MMKILLTTFPRLLCVGFLPVLQVHGGDSQPKLEAQTALPFAVEGFLPGGAWAPSPGCGLRVRTPNTVLSASCRGTVLYGALVFSLACGFRRMCCLLFSSLWLFGLVLLSRQVQSITLIV